MRPAHADVENRAMQQTRADVRIAHAVHLPRPRERQVACLQQKVLLIDAEPERAALEKRQLDAFVAMPIEAPVLPTIGVPIPDHLQARQRRRGSRRPG